jgi:dihydroflavonol-4-reductase
MGCALETGARKVVHVSGVVIFGKPADCPYTEESEVGPVRFSEYGKTKYAGDLVAWELHRTRGLPLVMIYPGGITGPNDPKIAGQYTRDLMQRRMPATVFKDVSFPWVHVRDVATGIVKAAEASDNVGEKYLLVAENLTFGEINDLISEISGVPLPKLRMPDSVAMAGAALLTAISSLTRRPPPWGMAIDQVRTMRQGGRADGSKAERELGITYTPIRVAFEDAIASFKEEHKVKEPGADI